MQVTMVKILHFSLFTHRLIVTLRAVGHEINIQKDMNILRKYTGPRYHVTFSMYAKCWHFVQNTYTVGCCENCQAGFWGNEMMKQNYELLTMSQAALYNRTKLRLELHCQNEIDVGPIEML